MAFTLQAVYWGGTQTLSDGSPYKFDNATGLGAASIRRLSERGPQQDGDTDLGYRADPSVLTLSFLFAGTSQADLDSKRDTLQQVFAPTTEPMQLRVIRDDGGTRQLDVFRTGPLDIPLVPAQRTGNFHRAVVQVKAGNPVWYDPNPGTAQSSAGTSPWYLAADTIGSANVLKTWEDIGQNEDWGYSGTIPHGSAWTLAVRAVRYTGDVGYMFHIGTPGDPESIYVSREAVPPRYRVKMALFDDPAIEEFLMDFGTHNYFFVTRALGTVGDMTYYRGNQSIGPGAGETTPAGGLVGTPRKWRVNHTGTAAGWGTPILRAALYDIRLTTPQHVALNATMAAADIPSVVEYGGDWKDHPIVRIQGPIANPVVTNTATGEKLDFTGSTIGSADFYEIDTRYGYKTVRNALGESKLDELSADSDLASFHLAPASEVPDGVNVFTLGGTSTGTATLMRVVYHNRYQSF